MDIILIIFLPSLFQTPVYLDEARCTFPRTEVTPRPAEVIPDRAKHSCEYFRVKNSTSWLREVVLG